MIGVLESDGTITAAEALAECLGKEDVTRAECVAMVEAGRTVPGRYCTGRLVIDERGRRCFSPLALDAKARAAAASPLPVATVAATSSASAPPWTLAALAVVAVVLAWRMAK
jgi:hypothetical protein